MILEGSVKVKAPIDKLYDFVMKPESIMEGSNPDIMANCMASCCWRVITEISKPCDSAAVTKSAQAGQ